MTKLIYGLKIQGDNGLTHLTTPINYFEAVNKKIQGVNAYNYIFDRVSNSFKMPSLVSLVTEYGVT